MHFFFESIAKRYKLRGYKFSRVFIRGIDVIQFWALSAIGTFVDTCTKIALFVDVLLGSIMLNFDIVLKWRH